MGDTENSTRALTMTPSVARNEENRSEAAIDRIWGQIGGSDGKTISCREY